MKILIVVTILLIVLPLVEVDTTPTLAYGPDSSTAAAPSVKLPQVGPNTVFDLFRNITNYLNQSFNSVQLPNIPNLAPQPSLGGLNLGTSGGVLNSVVSIVKKNIQVFINLVILFVKQIFLIISQQQ